MVKMKVKYWSCLFTAKAADDTDLTKHFSSMHNSMDELIESLKKFKENMVIEKKE